VWSSTITPSTKGSMFIITRLTTSNCSRRVWRYLRGNQNPYIEEEDNTMARRKSSKWQTMIYKTYI
jgi:hypothetical protein